jgi:hypothetical protein
MPGGTGLVVRQLQQVKSGVTVLAAKACMGLADLPSVPPRNRVVMHEDPLAGALRPAPQPISQTLVDLALATLSDYVGHVY